MTNSGESERQPRTVIWLNNTATNIAMASTFERASVAINAKTELEKYSSDEILDVVHTSLNALTRSPNQPLRERLLVLLGASIPFIKISNPSKLTAHYVTSLTTLPKETAPDNILAVVRAGIQLAPGFPKREDSYRPIARALDDLADGADSEILQATLATKKKLKADIVEYCRNQSELMRIPGMIGVLEQRLDNPDLTLAEIRRKKNLSEVRLRDILIALEEYGIIGREIRRSRRKSGIQ